MHASIQDGVPCGVSAIDTANDSVADSSLLKDSATFQHPSHRCFRVELNIASVAHVDRAACGSH